MPGCAATPLSAVVFGRLSTARDGSGGEPEKRVQRSDSTGKEHAVSEIEGVVSTCLLLPPHRQRSMADTADELLDLQIQVDTGREPET